MPQEGYRGPQVCKIVGITYRQLDHWDRTGLKSPSLEQAKGSGTQRLYSYQDVVELRIIKQLLDAGVTLQRARKAIDFLRESGDDLASASLVLGAAGSVLVRDDEELLDLLRGGQRVFNVVALSGVKGDVDSAIVQIVGGVSSPAPTAAKESSPPPARPANLA
ncbi:MAG TPA: MerR family transcriptional regulator [Acidimicrobiales bacterium]|nr:MerR family transcriptional regulator [Acidimicrobiales bacterium]